MSESSGALQVRLGRCRWDESDVGSREWRWVRVLYTARAPRDACVRGFRRSHHGAGLRCAAPPAGGAGEEAGRVLASKGAAVVAWMEPCSCFNYPHHQALRSGRRGRRLWRPWWRFHHLANHERRGQEPVVAKHPAHLRSTDSAAQTIRRVRVPMVIEARPLDEQRRPPGHPHGEVAAVGTARELYAEEALATCCLTRPCVEPPGLNSERSRHCSRINQNVSCQLLDGHKTSSRTINIHAEAFR